LIDEIDFNIVPVRIKITKLPIGLMNKDMGEEDDNGEVMVGTKLSKSQDPD